MKLVFENCGRNAVLGMIVFEAALRGKALDREAFERELSEAERYSEESYRRLMTPIPEEVMMPNAKKQAAGRKGALERQRRRINRQAAGRKGGLARKRK